MTDGKPRAVTPEPGPRQQNPTAAMIGYRQHRAAGDPIGGVRGDRQEAGRASGRAAALTQAANDLNDGRPRDYAHRETATPLPAWWYILYEKPVPPDAPRTRPPEGFARVMRKRRELAAARAELAGSMCVGPGSGDDPARAEELATGDAAAPPEAVTAHPGPAEASGSAPDPATAPDGGRAAEAAAWEAVSLASRAAARKQARRAGQRRAPVPRPAKAATGQPATGQPATELPARPARRCRRGCGYPSGSRGCKTTHGED